MNTFISSSIDVFILMRYFNCSRILAVLIPPHRTVLLQELLEMDNFVPHIRETYLSTYSAPSLPPRLIDGRCFRCLNLHGGEWWTNHHQFIIGSMCSGMDRSFLCNPPGSGRRFLSIYILSTQSICAMDPNTRLILTVSRAENFFRNYRHTAKTRSPTG